MAMATSVWDEVFQETKAPTKRGSVWDEVFEEKKPQSSTVGIAKQAGVGLAKGLAGAHGSIRELTGTNPKQSLLPSQKLRAQKESQGKEKELIRSSAEGNDIGPEGTGRTPTHEDIGNFLELLGVNTKAKTGGERIAQKTGESLGSAAAFGSGGIAKSLAALGGATGQ